MKFDKRKDINPKYLLLTLTIICILFFIMSFVARDQVAAIKNFTNKLMAPLQQGINEIGLWTDSKIENLNTIEELNQENAELKEQIEAYQTDKELDIETLEGIMHASVGDYIITGIHGEQYPCKPDIFEETYEEVTE